jgi:cobalt-precorrin-5B (C1)-methyltransferase
MILVFGGTTEGRKAAEVLEEGGSPFFYSTKTGMQDIRFHHGAVISGAMDAESMCSFCKEHKIRLIVDAAHPFASQLHKTVADVASKLSLPAIRYERIYPPRDPSITWIDDYNQIPRNIHSLLATTGVQSIAKLKSLEAEGIKVYYRILPRKSSIVLAHQQGAADKQLCYFENSANIDVEAEAILLKESGMSGGFLEKVEAAKAHGMKIIALKRPNTPKLFTLVNGPYGLRRAVEHLLPEFYPLHSGLTTGTCATGAAIAATMMFVRGERKVESGERIDLPTEVPVVLPNGETITVPVGYGISLPTGEGRGEAYAYCIKEAGDDPDVTNGIEVRASVSRCEVRGARCENSQCLADDNNQCVADENTSSICIEGGEGVGRFTLPGFDFPPGEAAINKGPREMIRQNVMAVENFSLFTLHSSLKIVLSIPNGSEIARRTFNPRLGIEGGISIIGVSGIVKPFSEEAFIESIHKCMQVAKASGTDRIVINSGAKSERFLKELYPELPTQAFVQYGNYIGETLTMADELNIPNVTLGVMLGKAVKLAQGHLDTHSKKATMDLDFIRQLLDEAHIVLDISDITLARELWERIPAELIDDFSTIVIHRCYQYCAPLLPNGHLTILLIDDNGKIYGKEI